jgi:hypothetical protein
MIAVVATSFLLGGALGLRYSILVIIPVIGFVLFVIALGGIVRHEALPTLGIAMATSNVALQFGYLAGCFSWLLLRSPLWPPNQLTASP